VFSTLLVANRGEIAVRVIRACRELGVRVVAVYSDADRAAPHVALADAAVRLGPPPATESYLDVAAILRAARATGAQAIHPGYGFLAENAAFARAVADAGLVFVGPPPDAIARMGDKLAGRRLMSALGVPVVPGSGAESSLEALAGEAERIGFPLLVKAAGGGGGRGMRRVENAERLEEALSSASREARSALGDPRVYLERLIDCGRHVEVQVLADAHGNVVHLFERECSLQRRFQKLVEEAPAPALDADVRDALCAAAVRGARAVDYRGAGSVEFLVRGRDWYFLEMNTRLQVEHPVTEMITGIDLVRAQIEVAAGVPLGFRQDDIRPRGHAIEARICVEDPSRGFAPSPGRISTFREPGGPGVRTDAGVVSGGEVPPEYDSLIAKVIAHAEDRTRALSRLERALRETVVLGVTSNVEFLLELLADPQVVAGEPDTQLVQRKYAQWQPRRSAPAEGALPVLLPEVAAAALAIATQRGAGSVGREATRPEHGDPWSLLGGFRTGQAPAPEEGATRGRRAAPAAGSDS
jgi:acetyl-CoA/propionyl-CoA carboxylase biotin carboxyl carrier protein